MEVKKIKLKWKTIILLLLIILFSIILLISVLNIIKWKVDSNKIKDQINEIDNSNVVEEREDDETTEIINPPEDKSNAYWDYIKMDLINVDFNKLKETNSDVKGWIQVNDTNINYPFVQAKDNSYYLTHSFDKSYNQAGWVFLDYRNDITNLDKNTIIYAHGRTGTTMFGSLKNIIKNDWYNSTDKYTIKLSNERENTLWQVFSVYHIKTTNDYIRLDFYTNNEYQIFLNILKDRSVYNFNVELNSNDKILTLSTCYNKTEKLVMHAKLIKKTTR